MKRIIYQNETGGISVIIPADALPIEQLAQKDVPAGTPYFIVEESDVPSDRTFRDAWEADFTAPDGYGLGYDGWLMLNTL